MATAAEVRSDGFEKCTACGLCLLPCPIWRATHDPMLTVLGRAKALQGGATTEAIRASVEACVLCGACAPICPEGIDTVGMTLGLRRDLAAGSGLAAAVREAVPSLASPPTAAPSQAETLLLPGPALGAETGIVNAVLGHLGGRGRVAAAADDGRDIALSLEAGLAWSPERERQFLAGLASARTLVVAEGLLHRLLRERLPRARVVGVAEALLGVRALRSALRSTDLLVIETRGYHAAFERRVRDVDGLRRETGCLINLDLNRLAIATGAASAQSRTGCTGPDLAAQLGFLPPGRRVERVVVECLLDREPFARTLGVPVVHLAELAGTVPPAS